MKYSVEFVDKAAKQFKKLDKPIQKRIRTWLRENLEGCENPRAYGKDLKGDLKGYWSYRVGDYRLVAKIIDDKIIILITEVGHRREIYE